MEMKNQKRARGYEGGRSRECATRIKSIEDDDDDDVASDREKRGTRDDDDVYDDDV